MMAPASSWHWCGQAEMMASLRRWHPILSGRQVILRAENLMSCVLSEPASAIPISANLHQ